MSFCGDPIKFLPQTWNSRMITTQNGGGKVLTATSDGNVIMDYPYTDTSNQKWSLSSNGTFSLDSGLCIYYTVYNTFMVSSACQTSPYNFWKSDGNGHIFLWQNQPVSLFTYDGTKVLTSIPNSQNYSNPGTQWITLETAIGCCTWPDPSNMPSEYQSVCGISYTPGRENQNNSCPIVMQGRCAQNWISNQPSCCDAYLANGNILNSYDVRNLVKNIITNGLQQRGNKFNPNDSFFDAIPTLCSATPGLCETFLKGSNNFCSQFTRQDLINDKTFKLQKICGCFLNDDQYPYTEKGITTSYCDPICVQNSPIHTGYESNDDKQQWAFHDCEQNVCVIDNVTIQIAKNTGDNNFSQNCGCSTGGKCQCFFSNVTIEGGSVDGINIDQTGCGQCYTFTDDIRNYTKVDCQTGQPIGGGTFIDSIINFFEDNKMAVIIISVILIIFIIVGIIYLFKKPSRMSAVNY